jgi:serine/threonine protein phosphatase PrpC
MFTVGAATRLGSRDENQDEYVVEHDIFAQRDAAAEDADDAKATMSSGVSLFAVLDGHGPRGMSVSGSCGESLKRHLALELDSDVAPDAGLECSRVVEQALLRAISSVHRECVQSCLHQVLADGKMRVADSGTTLVACAFVRCCGRCPGAGGDGDSGSTPSRRDSVVCGGVGDSRALLVGAADKFDVISPEHSLTNPTERDRLRGM